MKRNVAVIILDCVRKDFFEEYAPRLIQMSDVSVEQCYAASSWSTPSHASIFTGELPHRHGVHAHNLDFRELKNSTFLTEMNHHTIGTSTNLFAGPSFGFDTLFDEFWNASRNGLFMGGMNIEEFSQSSSSDGIKKYTDFLAEASRKGCLIRSLLNGMSVKLNDIIGTSPLPRLYDYGANSMIRGSINRLPDNEPFFYFANFMEAHSPYSPSIKYNSSIYDVPHGWSENAKEWEINENPSSYTDILEGRRDVYAASIDYLDRRVSYFIKEVIKKTERETTVFVTADHGENLAFESENFVWGHQGSLSHSLLDVPLVSINLPEKYTEFFERGSLSHLSLYNIITSVANDNPINIDPYKYIPAERIGFGPSTKPENFDYWDRAIRCVHDGKSRYEWDSLGNQFEYEIKGTSIEKKIREDIKIHNKYHDLFDIKIDDHKRSASLEGEIEISNHTEDRLSDLGYL